MQIKQIIPANVLCNIRIALKYDRCVHVAASLLCAAMHGMAAANVVMKVTTVNLMQAFIQ